MGKFKISYEIDTRGQVFTIPMIRNYILKGLENVAEVSVSHLHVKAVK